MSDQTPPAALVRRLGRDYGWLLAAAGLAVLVLTCSVPFVSGAAMSWNSGDPLAAPPRVAPAAGDATSGVPETSAAPATSPSPSPTPTRSRPPATRRPAASPTPPRTTPPTAAARAPVTLGPEGGRMGLWMMLQGYCASIDRSDPQAQLRSGTGQAEGNWECRWGRRGPDRRLIDMDAACRQRYGSVAFAQFSDRNDAFSWRCFRR